jgi:regulator of RNase E activity RraA
MHDELASALACIPTGTLATVLRQRGLSRIWMQGPRQLGTSPRRVAGKALTVRFVPAREDLTTPAALSSPNSLRALLDTVLDGYVMVASTGGILSAGVVGDILAARMVRNGFVALVTDGVVRDSSAVCRSGLPVWAQGSAAPPSVAGLHYCESATLVACGGVTVAPDDYIVADEDGAIVLPASLAKDAAREAQAKEHFEAWVLSKVEAGAALLGLYPPSAETKVRYERETALRKEDRA